MAIVDLKLTGSSDEVKSKKYIADLYDESTEVWEKVWGTDHMHYGFYEPNAYVTIKDHKSAQIRMIEEILAFAQLTDDSSKKPKNIVDIGCGLGGSSRYLAKKLGAKTCGINLSPYQIQRAQALTTDGLEEKVSFKVADALDQPFPDGQFDLVWCVEAVELMPDKIKCISEMARVAAPGATIIITLVCHRELAPDEKTLTPDEKTFMDKISNAYGFSELWPVSEYVKIAQSMGLQDFKTADWSDNVAPYCPAVQRAAWTWQGIVYLWRSGWKTIKQALGLKLMIEGYDKKLLRYFIITCRKPE